MDGMRVWGRLLRAAALSMSVAVTGCGTTIPEHTYPGLLEQPMAEAPEDLRAGDEIQVSFSKNYAYEGSYRFDVGDRLETRVRNRDSLTHQTVVLPDGRATFPLLPPVAVQGMSVEELAMTLNRLYARSLDDPSVSVLVLQPMARVDDFLELVQQPGLGAQLSFKLLAGGRIDLPLIGPSHAIGLSVDELQAKLQQAYDAVVPHLRVGVILRHRPQNAIYVFGEVKNGGVFPTDQSVSLLRSIAMAGGFEDTANLEQVIVIHRQSETSVSVKVVDVERAIGGKDPAAFGQWVEGGDVVFVPKTTIADANVWVDQYLRRMIPINIGTGVGYTIN